MRKRYYDIERIGKFWWVLEDGRGIAHSRKWSKCQTLINTIKRGFPFNGPPPEFFFGPPPLDIDLADEPHPLNNP